MIEFLHGTLEEALPTRVVVNVHGVGYLLEIPLSSFDRLPPPGQSVRILAHLYVREDAHILYGFMSGEERDLFRLLTHHVSGIGPKLAMAILSGMSVIRFKGAVVANDITALSKISGLGRKTAERIILELRDKVGASAAWQAASAENQTPASVQANDAMLALLALGYKQIDAVKALKAALEAQPGAELDSGEMVRLALKRLAS